MRVSYKYIKLEEYRRLFSHSHKADFQIMEMSIIFPRRGSTIEASRF